MSQTFTGVIQYANGKPAKDVTVKLFDKDVIGEDDDLTVAAGVSDAEGVFTVTYQEDRELNFADIYLPYLEFAYAFNGRSATHRKYIQPFNRVFKLPEYPPVNFVPAENGFQFVNRFPGYWLPFSIPTIPDIPSVSAIYGLCGGMSATALDFLMAGMPIPQRRRRPGRITPLHQFLHRRQVDSLTMGKQVVRFIRWMALPDEAVQLRTAEAVKELKPRLDAGIPTPIGLVYISSKETWEIWQNHQVLAVNYTEEDGVIHIQVYEPNYPRRNDVFIKCWPDGRGGLLSAQLMGKKSKHVRGFFTMPYEPMKPPRILIDGSSEE
jgi:5-hydroxyisourate hydrolase-like protein (transthyretin family)